MSIVKHSPFAGALLLAMTFGCAPEPSRPVTSLPVASRETWAEQIESVRAGRQTEIHCSDSMVTFDEWQALVRGCESLEVLDVESLEVTATQSNANPFALIAGLPRLRQLRIGSSVTDADLAQIGAISTLRVLNLPGGDFTDQGLRALSALSHLELLRFSSPQVTDEGMSTIARYPALRFLHLINVPISDDGLIPFAGVDRLESLYLDGCHCTEQGILRLLKAQPALHLHRDQLHIPDDPHAHQH